jgi:putative peptidoglycan lipid II flippase
MSQQTTEFPNTEHRPVKQVGLLRATGTVGGMTILSRISGFTRDIVFARLFGADGITDAFFVAFKIPNFFRRLFAEGAFSQAFIPVFAEHKEKHGLEALRSLVSHVGGALFACLLLLTTLMAAAAPLVIMLFAPGFIDDPERHELAAAMLRYTAFYLLFISLVALAGSIQNSFRRFAAPAFTPVLLNLTLISCALWLSPLMEIPIMALAIGTFLAGLIQLLFQIPFLARLGMLPRLRFEWRHEGMRKVVKLMLPAMLGSAVVQINLMLDTILASFLIAGSVTWLYFSDRLVELPLGVFSIAIATVILPSLSSKHAQEDVHGFSRNLDWGLKLTTLITTPAALGIVILAGPILLSLFQHGEFSVNDAAMARISLIAYAVGLPAFGYTKILAPGFFARHDTRTPVKIAVHSMLAKLALNIALVIPLYMNDIAWAHAGLALSTSLSAWIQTVLLYRKLRKENAYQPQSGWAKLLMQIFIATTAMSAILYFANPALEIWLAFPLWQRGLILSGLIVPAIAVFFCVMWLFGMRVRDFRGHH